MPSVREYFKKKEKQQTDEFHKKLVRHRLAVIYRTVLAIAVVSAFLVACYISYQNKIYTTYETISSSQRAEIENASYVNYNGNILKYSKDGATAMDINNNMLWNQTYEMQNPMVDICGEYVAIGDYKGNRIFVMNSSGLQGEIELRMSILSFRVAANGNMAITLDGGNVTWIHLYDKNGVLIAESSATMSNNGYPLAVDISDDSKLLSVSYLNVDSSSQKSSVAFYNFGGVGQSKIDNYVSGFDYVNTIVPYVRFLNESTCLAVGNDRMTIFKGKEIPVVSFQMNMEDELQGVFNSDKYVGLVFREGTENAKYRIDVYDTNGTLCITEPFNIDYTDVLIHKEQIMIYNNAECVLYNAKGIQKFAGEFDMPVTLVLPTASPTRFVLVGPDSTKTIRLG